MARDDHYIELSKRLEGASNRAAGLICLLIIADCATSWSRLLTAIAFHLVVFPINILLTRMLVPRMGARAEIVRSMFNVFPVTLGYHLIDWPIAVWLWLPYLALAFDQFGGRYTLHSVVIQCVGVSVSGLIGGVSPLVPIAFSLLTFIAWDLGGGRLRIIRAMLTEAEANRETLAAEIEARAQAETELVEASRQAGMAEVATGVLHNVGNVLTSVNIASSLSLERLRGSRIVNLEKLVAMSEQHPGGLAGLAASPKGPAVTALLTGTVKELGEERRQLESELSDVMANVDHIKGIVSAQQAFACVASTHESVDVEEAISAALLIGSSTFSANVQIVREIADAPPLIPDRHKVLQILVNLVSNAGQALPEGGRITVRLKTNTERVQVEVEDTGVGIPQDHLDKVFRHGFTTKPRGHGFGLHASANSARELGGSLAVISAGLGHGATFTLDLPQEAA
jgi:signal transduction histidine kinase